MPEPEAPKDQPAAAPKNSSPAIGSLWKERYRIEKELGRGGFGVVYLARDQQLHSKAVVLKVLLDDSTRDPYFQKKFQQEIEALARIDHPGVVGVLDVGQSPESQPFLVMQFVEGVTLRSAIPKEGMEFSRAAHILRQVGQALGAAHDKGIYHRDLKPENIMLTRAGQTEEYVKLIDFGIAAVRDSQVGQQSAQQTQASRVVGTLSYMAPEQVLGKGSPSSDIYSLGVIAFEMLTGERPDVSWEGVAKKPRELRPEIPEAAQQVILTALSYQPEKRMANPREFGDQVARALGGESASSLPAVTTKTPAVTPSSGDGLEMASALFMDIVAYSKMKTNLQSRHITDLVNIVRETNAYRRAQQSDQIISLPTGDGMALVFFQSPTAALECATEISRALKTNPDIKLRMGVHTGPVYRVADINTNINVAGGGINLAQRVMDCGDAGHILVSKAVADILSELSDWEPTLHDLGEAEVKHGVKVNIVNFYTSEVGNSAIPEKVKKSQALSAPASLPGGASPAAVPALQPTVAQPMRAPAPTSLPVSAPIMPVIPQPVARKSGGALALGGVGALVVAVVVVAAMKFGPWNKSTEPPGSGPASSQSSFGPTGGSGSGSSESSTRNASPTPGVFPPSGPPPANPALATTPSTGGSKGAPSAATQPQGVPNGAHPQGNRALKRWEDEAKAAQADTSSKAAPATPPATLATPAERAALVKARQRMIQLASRAEAINQSIHNLEQQQRKQGIGLRVDMAAARANVEYLMGETKASIDSKDYEAANQSMDLAEPQIEKLEKFLGR